MQNAAEQAVSRIKARLIMQHPFFGVCLLKKDITLDPSVESLSVDRGGAVRANPEYVTKISTAQGIFSMAHETFHYMMGHHDRIAGRNEKKWNRACDAVTNGILITNNIGEPPPGVFTWPKAEDMSPEELYPLLPDEDDDDDGDQPGGGDQPTRGTGGGGGGLGNDLSQTGGGDTPKEREQQRKQDVNDANVAAKMKGSGLGNLQRIIDDMLEVVTPWHEILERYMTGMIKDDITWSRPNRRMLHQGLYLPGKADVPSMGEIVVEIDTSGSIGQAELNEFGGHINRILEQCNPSKVHIVYTDSAIRHVDVFTPDEFPIPLAAHGGGGTDMTKVFDYVVSEGLTPDAVVILTDGYTPFGEDPGFPVVWAMTTDMKAPFGLNVDIRDK